MNDWNKDIIERHEAAGKIRLEEYYQSMPG